MTAFQLDVRTCANNQPKLHFDHIFSSDWHLGTNQCKAKGLTRMLHNIQAYNITLVGDIVDFWHAAEHGLTIGPWQRQVIAGVLRNKANTTFLPGNHDEKFRGKLIPSNAHTDSTLVDHHSLIGKSLAGIKFEDSTTYITKSGKNLLVCHGDIFDNKLRKERGQGLYKIGDTLLEASYATEHFLNRALGTDDISIIGALSHSFAHVAEKESQMKSNALDYIRTNHLDGIICGHSHISSIEKTDDDLLFINEGSATGHGPQFFAEDKNGTMAILTWRKKGLRIQDEFGSDSFVKWSSLGLDHFAETPHPIEDNFTHQADRLINLMDRAVPPSRFLTKEHTHTPATKPQQDNISTPSLTLDL